MHSWCGNAQGGVSSCLFLSHYDDVHYETCGFQTQTPGWLTELRRDACDDNPNHCVTWNLDGHPVQQETNPSWLRYWLSWLDRQHHLPQEEHITGHKESIPQGSVISVDLCFRYYLHYVWRMEDKICYVLAYYSIILYHFHLAFIANTYFVTAGPLHTKAKLKVEIRQLRNADKCKSLLHMQCSLAVCRTLQAYLKQHTGSGFVTGAYVCGQLSLLSLWNMKSTS